MMTGKVLVVDDDRNLLEVIRMRLESESYEVTTTLREEEAMQLIKGQSFDLSIIDLQLAESDGITLMEEIHLINPDLPIIILTAYGSIESAVEAVKRGAYNYLTKPFDPHELLNQIEKAQEKRRLTNDIKMLKGLLEERFDYTNIIAKSEKMQSVLNQVYRVAKTDSTIYIYGENGTGKELIAGALHLASNRNDKPFVAVNCAAIPETLLESEFFGFEKGSFTGAVQSTKGFFTQAHEGTIFLDEIANMSLSMQNKILRVLQERQFYPIGSKKPIEVDVRVIIATNKDLIKEINEGRFREDLFYRIHVIPINLPPLREKKEDIPLLTQFFIEKFSKQMRKDVKGLTPKAMQKLMLYDWPGNVRQLENIIEYAMAMTHQNVITDDLILTRGNISKASELAGKYRADFYNLLRKYKLNPEDFKKV
jgi:two-component system response regulator GlrR